MKTTVELPDALFRKAKSAAAHEGMSLKAFFAEAIKERLAHQTPSEKNVPAWERVFGGLRSLHRENLRVDQLIAAEFESIDEEEWR